MKTLVIIVLIVLSAVAGCKKKDSKMVAEVRAEAAKTVADKEEKLALWAGETVKKIQYVQDPRTGICFAYFWGGDAHGGPVLATVACEKIPTELLLKAKIK